jgi:hypothetical protein
VTRLIITFVLCVAAVVAFNALWDLSGLDTGGVTNSAWWNGQLGLLIILFVARLCEGSRS